MILSQFMSLKEFTQTYFPLGFKNIRAPQIIYKAVSQNFKTNFDHIYKGIKYLDDTFAFKSQNNKPPDVKYDYNAIIDAYTFQYLPRYFHIPKIGIRSLLINSKSFSFSNKIRVLDIGSGTGAIPLGLCHIFNNSKFNDISLEITAVDESSLALKRQEDLLSYTGYLNSRHSWKPLNITLSPENIAKYLYGNNWDLIFASNFLSELENDSAVEIVSLFTKLLSKHGAFIISDIQHDRVKELIADISKQSRRKAFTIYYPCKRGHCCKDDQCFTWNNYFIKDRDIQINGNILIGYNNYMRIFLVIINNNGQTIYDGFSTTKGWDYSVAAYNHVQKKQFLCGMANLNITGFVQTGSIYCINTDTKQYNLKVAI